MKIIRIYCVVLAIMIISAACKKEKLPDCRISSYSSEGLVRIKYNNDGTINSIVADDAKITYEYSGNQRIVTWHIGPGDDFVARYHVTLNAAGLVSNLRVDQDSDGKSWYNTTYEYNGVELAKATTGSSTGQNQAITTFNWVNHVLVSETTGAVTRNYSFYEDQPRRDGDYLWLLKNVYGGETVRSKTLLKSYDNETYKYEFDASGRISAMITDDGTESRKVSYQYECN